MLAALKYINIHTLPKPGQVNSRALWNAREELAGPFAAIIALALTKTERPEDWRMTKVVSLFMKG